MTFLDLINTALTQLPLKKERAKCRIVYKILYAARVLIGQYFSTVIPVNLVTIVELAYTQQITHFYDFFLEITISVNFVERIIEY